MTGVFPLRKTLNTLPFKPCFAKKASPILSDLDKGNKQVYNNISHAKQNQRSPHDKNIIYLFTRGK